MEANLLDQGLFDPPARTQRGRRFFENKGCADCHEDGSAPDLKDKDWSPATLAASVRTHGPLMLAEFERAGRSWPQLNSAQAADLIAYLDQRR